MEFLNFTILEIMLFLGFISILLEIFFLSGIGLLFIGLGSFSTAGILYLESSSTEYVYFILGIASIIWSAILWKPLKTWNNRATMPRNIDIIGSKAEIIESDIKQGNIGKITWSGTIMNAKLSENEKNTLKIGTQCKIREVKGNILIIESTD